MHGAATYVLLVLTTLCVRLSQDALGHFVLIFPHTFHVQDSLVVADK
jgi:hypothetical protein